MPLISVIVPIYNTETYLKNCIDSVINQTYTDFELILVDDGSFDESPKICDEYKLCDKRIKVIHQDNGGVSAARAAGVRYASGDYLYFLDSDDAIECDTLKAMLEYMSKDIDIVIFECSRTSILSKDEYAKELLKFKYWSTCGKLYRRQLFDYVVTVPRQFNIGEDFLMQLRLLNNIQNSIKTVNIHKYYYNKESVTSVQQGRKQSCEYEVNFIKEAERSISKTIAASPLIDECFYKWKVKYLGGLTSLQCKLDYSAPWIVEILKKKDNYKLSIKERNTIRSINHNTSRLLLIGEERLRKILRYIRRGIYRLVNENSIYKA